jgi:adenylate cyclase
VTSERVQRRLAAALAAEVAGYLRFMGADEIGALQVLKADRRELITPPSQPSKADRQDNGDGGGLFVAIG